jgi:N-acetylmuramoyl-L-alanine amidase
VSAALALSAASLEAQTAPSLTVERADGSRSTVVVRLDRGYAAIPVSVVEELGWTVTEGDGEVSFAAAGEISVAMRLASPFFRWDGVVLQMTDPPYRTGGRTFVPLQFLTDFLPRRLPGLYDFDGARALLRAGEVELIGRPGVAAARAETPDRPPAEDEEEPLPDLLDPIGGDAVSDQNSAETVRNAGPSAYDGVRVVVIDPGHGGADPGALGPDGLREKDVALAIGVRVAEQLRRVPELEVHLIRDDDTFVDVWERGQIATNLKGERPGVFVSIHANSFPARREARGFETYFLSDARTEHERRVSAIENAPITMNPEFADDQQLADLDFILRDLKNYEHAHWSAELAGLVQAELDPVHPGPNRGVKQGVLAVLTNALMPSVLVEVGYLSNPTEASEIGSDGFHDASAEAIGQAVVRFFERYPPGSGTGGTSARR